MTHADSVASSANSAALEVIATELERVIRRWQQLPLDHALCAYPAVRDLVQTVADQGAMARNLPVTNVPDLGPSVVMDQLLVVVFDYQSADLDVESLANRLTELRRRLP